MEPFCGLPMVTQFTNGQQKSLNLNSRMESWVIDLGQNPYYYTMPFPASHKNCHLVLNSCQFHYIAIIIAVTYKREKHVHIYFIDI